MGCLPDWMLKRDVSIQPLEDVIKREGKISYGVGSYGIDLRVGYKFDIFSPVNATEIDPKKFDSRSLIRKDLTPGKCLFIKHPTGPKGGFPEFYCSGCGNEVDTPYDRVCKVYGDVPNHILIPPHSFALAETIEYIKIPRDTICIVTNKSTYARCGIVLPCTVLEPEWEGIVTLEIGNTTPLPARVYCGEGICQCLFFRTDGYRECTERMVSNLLDIEDLQLHSDYMKCLGRGSCKTSYKDKKGRYDKQTSITLPSADSSS